MSKRRVECPACGQTFKTTVPGTCPECRETVTASDFSLFDSA